MRYHVKWRLRDNMMEVTPLLLKEWSQAAVAVNTLRRGRWCFPGVPYEWGRNGHFQQNKRRRLLLQLDTKVDEMRWNSGNFPVFRETFCSLLIFHLIPLYSSWCTRKKELIQKKNTSTNTNSSSMSHDYRVSRRRQGSGFRCRMTRRDLRNILARQACAWRLKSSPLLETTAFDFCVPHHAYASVITWLKPVITLWEACSAAALL